MAVASRRLTWMPPVSLSTSYLTGGPSSGISMMALKSSGGFTPGAISLTFMYAKPFCGSLDWDHPAIVTACALHPVLADTGSGRPATRHDDGDHQRRSRRRRLINSRERPV